MILRDFKKDSLNLDFSTPNLNKEVENDEQGRTSQIHFR